MNYTIYINYMVIKNKNFKIRSFFMKNIINGAIYDVNLKGVDASEFKGSHPAVIVRTLKEEKIFFVVPLTTYTKDRWDKAK